MRSTSRPSGPASSAPTARRSPSLALSANTSEGTAIGNDYGFDRVFSRLIEAHGRAGDVAIAISTSGNSPNVIEAVAEAKRRGLRTISLLGKGGGECSDGTGAVTWRTWAWAKRKVRD